MHNTIPPLQLKWLENFPETNTTPHYQTVGAAGMDIESAESVLIEKGQSKIIHTGLAFAVPDGHEMQVRSRSGLAAKHGVFVTNGIGTIDCDYRGELMVLLTNVGPKDYQINVGDRIAQLVLAPIYRPVKLEIVSVLSRTDRGVGGLGSTGR